MYNLKIESLLTKAGVTSKIDDSGTSIGRRYARTDECGIPFAITVDFDTLADDTVTLRDLNTLKQVRMKVSVNIWDNKLYFRFKMQQTQLLTWPLAQKSGMKCSSNTLLLNPRNLTKMPKIDDDDDALNQYLVPINSLKTLNLILVYSDSNLSIFNSLLFNTTNAFINVSNN